ncbi:MAG: hypothetical protein HRU20_17940 [Pseudomonadales bacterium]|nr:hypothetical protein [Pseudomonadales bacterium]
MKKVYLLVLLFTISSSAYSKDIVDSLKDMRKQSEDFRELSIDCLVELKVSKDKGWKSDECVEYQQLSKTELRVFKEKLKIKSDLFRDYSKNKEGSKRRIKRGVNQLLTIKYNMQSMKEITNNFKVL